MSGIIGGAGSKSGVIGETEIDYEEGTWTPTLLVGTIQSLGDARYVKIGSQVFLYIDYFETDSTDNATNQGVSNFPFTVGDSYSSAVSVNNSANAKRSLAIQNDTHSFFYPAGSTTSSPSSDIISKGFYGWTMSYATI